MEKKFKVWDKEYNRFLINDPHIFLDLKGHVYNLQTGEGGANLYELVQYIGLKDENGKEVYEGDIIKHSNPNFGYGDPKQPSFLTTVIKSIEDLYDDEFLHLTIECGEVFGNIYENPELL